MITSQFAPLPPKRYSVIMCDPPWEYGTVQFHCKASRNKQRQYKYIKAASDHYPTVPLEELKTLDVSSIAADNCVLFMWMCGPLIASGLELGNHWGFKFEDFAFIWNKQRANPGFYTMSGVEYVGIFSKGNYIEPKSTEHQYVAEKITVHSQKPNEIRKRIERMYPNHSKCELFARQWIENWDVWGNEVDMNAKLPAIF